MSWFKNIFLVFCSIVFAIVASEVSLGFLGMYDDLVTAKLVPSNTVWSRPSSVKDSRKHQILNYDMDIIFDEMGVRNHSQSALSPNADLVGFFGDSFTENRRVPDEYTFTTMLNEISGERKAVNFGISGFGLEQSYQRYKNQKDNFQLRDVVYVFCSNDLRNMYEVELFSIAENTENQLLNNFQNGNVSYSQRFYRFLGKFRLTYLGIESYYKTKAIVLSKTDIASTYANKFINPKQKEHSKRLHDTFADSIHANALSDTPTDKTLHYIEKFRIILNLWQSEVEANGGTFHLAILPRDDERELIEVMLKGHMEDYNVIHLPKAEELNHLQDFSTVFKYPGHWNEMGNLAAIETLVSIFPQFMSNSNEDINKFILDKRESILSLYAKYNNKPAPAVEGS